MKADADGTPTEQLRARAGWINATTRRERTKAGDVPYGKTCGTCNSWTGTAIDQRCLCPVLQCTTHTAAVCERWTLPRRADRPRPQPTRPAAE